MKFNTAVSSFMEFVNFALKNKESVGKDTIKIFLVLLSPFVPHITEELWHYLGKKDSIHKQKWPQYNPEFIKEETIILVVQVNGRLRDTFEVRSGISEEEAKELSLERNPIKKRLEGQKIKRVIFVPNKLINIII